MESVEIDDGYIGPEQTPSAEPAVTKVEEETVASSPKAAGESESLCLLFS